jgi:methionine-rich copper-binding protein CopC
MLAATSWSPAMRIFKPAGLLAALFLAAPLPVFAHAHLVASEPAEGSRSAKVDHLRLAFSEALEGRLSSIRLQTVEERTVTEPGAQIDPSDPKVMMVSFYERLAPGEYQVRWTAVAADGHRIQGHYRFVVSP